ncbi:MAG TPA: N-6 DNA methylase [Fervidobacterium sp.]|nr:N-6 DNA methylase [Fervidobacterium sp.]
MQENILTDSWKQPKFSKRKIETYDQLSLFDYDGVFLSNEYLSLHDVCRILNISFATGQNWVRLGKIIPQKIIGKDSFFTREYIQSFILSINKTDSKILKRRRNKKNINSFSVCNGYIYDKKNKAIIQSVITETSRTFTDKELRMILANFALQLFAQKMRLDKQEGNLIELFLENKLRLGNLSQLIYDLLNGDCPSNFDEEVASVLQKTVCYVKGQDTLGFVYLSLSNMNRRKAYGLYYTPEFVAKELVNREIEVNDLSTVRVFDPACGSGNFLLALSNRGLSLEQLYGQDIDEIAIELARINMALEYACDDVEILYKHFICADSLTNWINQDIDLVIGNPPWGYDFSDEQKTSLSLVYESARCTRPESYDLFVEQALKNSSYGGRIAFVLPEAILNVKSHQAIRDIILRHSHFEFVSYLGDVFEGVQCPTILLGIRKEEKSSVKNCRVSFDESFFIVHEERKIDSKNIALNISDDEYRCLSKIESVPSANLRKNAAFALGIVTGDNEKYLTNIKSTGNEVVLKGTDVYRFRYVDGKNFIKFMPESFQQVAPIQFYRASEKLIYRFICNTLVFAYDNKGRLTLNSANIVIPNIPGLSIKYILAILNSRVALFFWKKNYNSFKVLKSHIESIPIPLISEREQSYIIDIVNQILLSDNTLILKLYEELDFLVMKAFDLEEKEINTIRKFTDDMNLFLE